MVKTLYLFAFAALLAVAAMPATAQTGDDALRFTQRLPLASAELAGMAGVGLAGRGDLGDLYRNPAGLGLLERSQFSVGLNTASVTDDAVFSVPGFTATSSSDASATRLGTLSYAYRFPTAQGSLVIGAGIAQTGSFDRTLRFVGDNGLNSITEFFLPLQGEYELFEDADGVYPEFSRTLSFIGFEAYAIDLFVEDLPDGSQQYFFDPAVVAGTVEQRGLVVEEGRMNEFTIGGALEASKDVMVGLSLNVPYGEYRFNRLFEEEDLRNDNDGTGGTFDFDYLSFSEAFTSTMVGINLRAGLSTEVANNVRLGFTVETPTVYSIDESYDTVLFTQFDDGFAAEYGDDPSEDAGRGDFDYELRTPWKLGAGVAFSSGNLAAHGDVEWVDWSQMELSSGTYSFASENLVIQERLGAVTSVRLGGSYAFGDITARAGLAIQPDPREESFETFDRDRSLVSAGLSFKVNPQFMLDLSWMQERFDDQYVPYADVPDAPVVSEELRRNFVSFGVRVAL